MKKIILLISIVAFANNASAQCDQIYRFYRQFNNNIGAYLETNFDKRSDCYKGKTFGEMMSDMEITPISYSYVRSIYAYVNKTTIPYIELIFQHASNGIYNPLRDIYIRIYWETPFDSKEFASIKEYPISNWVSQHADFFSNKVIKSIEYNPYIKYLRDKESIMPKERPAL
jgi:hypothetical protein